MKQLRLLKLKMGIGLLALIGAVGISGIAEARVSLNELLQRIEALENAPSVIPTLNDLQQRIEELEDAPPATQAIFGSGPIAHFTADRLVLEAVNASTLQVRRTASGGLITVGMTDLESCASSGGGFQNTSNMGQRGRFTVTAGDTLQANLCFEGSGIFIHVDDGNEATLFRCWRRTSNHNTCQRIRP